MTLRPGVLLDRDGVLNPDPGFVHRAEDAALYSDVSSALRVLQDRGFVLAVVSNQSGIGRGYFTDEDAQGFNRQLSALLAMAGVDIPPERFYYCPHRSDEDCGCRKPAPGLICRAIHDLGLDPSRTVFVGDRESDVEAAALACIRGVLLCRVRVAPSMYAWATIRTLADLPLLLASVETSARSTGD